jgi:hypothetical protein
MSKSDPTPREVTDFDGEIAEGQQFRNKYQEHDNPPATRIIQILNKEAGNTVTYWVVERHRLRELAPTDANTFTMSTKNLLENYEELPITAGSENID